MEAFWICSFLKLGCVSKALFVCISHFRLLNLWVYVLICLRCVFLSLPFDKKALVCLCSV